MLQKFFRVFFANSGNRTDIPDSAQGNGQVSFTEGYNSNYELDPATYPNGRYIERTLMNGLFYRMTQAIAALQSDFPEWIAPSDNGGTAYAYRAGVIVRVVDTSQGAVAGVWQSQVANNTQTPGVIPSGQTAQWVVAPLLSTITTALATLAQTVTTGLDGKANVGGNNATGTWPISVTGNAATAISATNALNLIDQGTIAGTVTAVTQPAGTGVAAGGVWSATGLTSGNIQAFAEIGGKIIAASVGFLPPGYGVLSSSDGGKTFTKINATITFQALLTVGSVLLGGSTGGVFRSTDNGVTWTAVAGTTSLNVVGFFNTGTAILALGGTNIWRSTDGGTSFTATTGAATVSAALKTSTGKLLAVGNGVWQSTDDGVTWAQTSEITSSLKGIVTVGSKILAIGLSGALRVSSDDGLTWTAGPNIGSTINTLINASGTLLAASAQGLGIYSSSDGGTTWQQSNFTTASVLSFYISPAYGVFAGTSGVGALLAVSPNAVATTAYADKASIGIGQTWQDVSSSRVSGTTYTNSTGKPIMVVCGGNQIDSLSELTVIVGGITLPYVGGGAGGDSRRSVALSFIVPNGATYTMTYRAGITGSTMRTSELR